MGPQGLPKVEKALVVLYGRNISAVYMHYLKFGALDTTASVALGLKIIPGVTNTISCGRMLT